MIAEHHLAMTDKAADSIAIRATRAYVDLDAIAANVLALRGALPEATRLMAVVKADAYGHGAPWVAKAALQAGAALLGVATVSEGELLRAHGIEAPIVLLGSIDVDEARAACLAGLEITIAEERLLSAVQAAAQEASVSAPVAVHLKVDTGLRRYGALPDLAVALAQRIASDPRLQFAGLCTHFASADEPAEPFTDEQAQVFARVVTMLREAGISIPARHVANSAAVLTGKSGDCEIARPGIALYGVPPSNEVVLLPGMRPAMRIESRIARLIPIDAGDTVGYNRTFRAAKSTTGALIPLGYADGYRRSLAGKAWVGIAGQPAPLLGRVSMDQIVVAIPPGCGAHVGDPIHIMGGGPDLCSTTVADLAEIMETNTYEVLVGIRQRIPRIYVKHGEVVAVRSQTGVSAIA